MTNTLHYPNGMPASLRDVWDVIDQLGMTLANSAQHQAKAKELGSDERIGLSEEEEARTIQNRNRLLTFLVQNHGDKLKPQARYTVVTKEKNDKGRHFRKGEFRLFIGEYSAFIIEIGVTTDNLDVDPKKMRRVLQVNDDSQFRSAKTAEERKELVKQFVSDKL